MLRAALTKIMPIELSRIRLWQLLSPALPIGGFSYSQGLELAVADGWLCSPDDAADWILSVGSLILPQLDLPYLRCLRERLEDREAFTALDQALLAHRESDELRAEDRHLGRALLRLLAALVPSDRLPPPPLALASAFAVACEQFGVDREEMLAGYGWIWFEQQVAAATKLIPLGSHDSQRLLLRCGERLGGLVEASRAVSLEQAGVSLPGVALASALHETQYSRHYQS